MPSSAQASACDVTELYRQQHQWLKNWLRLRLNCSHSAADLAQDTFLRLLNKPEPVQIQAPRSFLAKVAKSVLSNHYRRQKLERAYLTSRLRLTDDLSLILGSRVINWSSDTSDRPYGGGETKVKREENGVFIPYAGVVYDLDDTWSVYASYTSIFNPQASWVRSEDNKPLEPMQGKGYEIGVKGNHFDGRLNSSLALYKLQQDNLAIWQHDNVYSAEQDTTSKGVELEFNGELAEGWQASAGYTYSVTTDADDQRIVTGLPRNSFKTFTRYRLQGPLDKLTVGGGVNWQSKVGGDLHTFTQGSYAVTNLMARYDISRNLSASANVNNLFDRTYYSNAGSYGNYGAPRNLMTSFKYNC